MGFKIRVSVKGFFFDTEGKVVLAKSPYGDFWAAPGGGLEEDEHLKQALERELYEETGFRGVADDNVVFLQDHITEAGTKQFEVFFTGKITSFDQNAEGDHEAKLFDKESFEKIEFRPSGINPFDLPKGVRYKELP